MWPYLESVIRNGESVSLAGITGGKALFKPAGALLGSAVVESIGHGIAVRLLLEVVVTDFGSDGKSDSAVLDIYVGDMPADTTAEDEAYANYADIIGWDDEDDEESPISEWRFKNKKAFGFSGECEDGSIMLLMCVEILKGALLIASIIAPDDEAVGKWAKYIEEKLTVRATK